MMTPMINETVVADRVQAARDRAAHRRLARAARIGTMRRSGIQTLRHAVGQGLILMGERLVDRSPPPDPEAVRRAA